MTKSVLYIKKEKESYIAHFSEYPHIVITAKTKQDAIYNLKKKITTYLQNSDGTPELFEKQANKAKLKIL
jgi:predicted RNase H-like HicB family nuclease